MNSDGEDLYKPSGATAVADAPSQQPVSAPTPPAPPANNNFSWTAAEFIDHQRSAGWYLLLFLATIILAVATYFLTKEYFAVGTIAIVGIIVGFYARQKPRQITCELNESGLRINEKTYNYALFKSFALIKNGEHNSVQLMPLKKFMPAVTAYYNAADEEKISDILGEHLPYEDAKPDHIDSLSRRLKL